jgi:hypothetical protein
MFGLRVGMHLLSMFCIMVLGMVAWLAPHMDWSRVKDESLFSSRGLVVVGLAAWVMVTLMWSLFSRLPLTKTCSKCKGGGRSLQPCGHAESCDDCGGCGRIEKK